MFPYSVLSSHFHFSCQVFSPLPKYTATTSIRYSRDIAYTPISQRKRKPLEGKKNFQLDTKAYKLVHTYLLLSPSCFNGRGFSFPICYELKCIPQNSSAEALTPNVTVLGSRAHWKETKANEVSKDGVLISRDYLPYKKRKRYQKAHRRKTRRTQGESNHLIHQREKPHRNKP